MDLRNFKLKEQSLYDSSLDFIITHDIKEYISNNNVEVCKLVISNSTNLSDIKENIISNLDVSIATIKKYGEYKDNIINKEYEYLDITPKDINKDNALKILQKYLNVNTNEVMAIGDNLNDLEMVKNSGIGVSVANRI